MKTVTLQKRKHKLSQAEEQLEYLAQGVFKGELPPFNNKIKEHLKKGLVPKKLEILQINVGYMCNQVCAHCHVDAGPDRKEIMSQKTMDYCLEVIKNSGVSTVDLTGGAPEMNPNFRWFVKALYKIGIKDLIVRSNLTIIEANKKYYDLPEFFKKYQIHVISSLPHWTANKTDQQRGKGVFNSSIKALKRLNAVGYGKSNSGLILDLVYNPSGAFFPGNQKALELDFKKKLFEHFEINFNKLYTITNLPVSRFLEYLIASENYEEYMYSLVQAFNPASLSKLMCTNTLSVGWNGYLYDCDFNQMLDLKVNNNIQHIKDFNEQLLENRSIAVSQHCYGCTAGAGSSCQGSIT